MTASNAELWERYRKYLCVCPSLGFTLDISRMDFEEGFFEKMAGAMRKAFDAMDRLEAGAIANPDEKRMVGHYWLRDSARAPKPEIRLEIEETLGAVKAFARKIHKGQIKAENGKKFTDVLVIGIGGSALGPQFVSDALTTPVDKMRIWFFDNTDPDGMDRVLTGLGKDLARTLSVVISKSGGTKETRNGMLAAARAYEAEGMSFAKHAVAVTGKGSELDKVAEEGGWIARLPMWDWVGGRTSEMSAVGLLPAALQGIPIDALLAGARDMDEITRLYDTDKNPAALLALMWYHTQRPAAGSAGKDMVVLPYKDRLLLFSRYLQQLVMESLGKETDRNGQIVHAGIAVYGNKGSTDQHAYVQQLREGTNNFFATFVEVLRDRFNPTGEAGDEVATLSDSCELLVEDMTVSGDYLDGFFQGTRTALTQNGRESITITVDELSPRTVGVLIALFERAVGLYAELININAYHQPGVEAGKKAAGVVIALQRKILAHLRGGAAGSAEQIAMAIGAAAEVETVHHILRHLAANPEHKVVASGEGLLDVTYRGA